MKQARLLLQQQHQQHLLPTSEASSTSTAASATSATSTATGTSTAATPKLEATTPANKAEEATATSADKKKHQLFQLDKV